MKRDDYLELYNKTVFQKQVEKQKEFTQVSKDQSPSKKKLLQREKSADARKSRQPAIEQYLLHDST